EPAWEDDEQIAVLDAYDPDAEEPEDSTDEDPMVGDATGADSTGGDSTGDEPAAEGAPQTPAEEARAASPEADHAGAPAHQDRTDDDTAAGTAEPITAPDPEDAQTTEEPA